MNALVLILLALMSSLTMANQDVGQLKLDKMRRLRDMSKDGLIEFTSKEYE